MDEIRKIWFTSEFRDYQNILRVQERFKGLFKKSTEVFLPCKVLGSFGCRTKGPLSWRFNDGFPEKDKEKVKGDARVQKLKDADVYQGGEQEYSFTYVEQEGCKFQSQVKGSWKLSKDQGCLLALMCISSSDYIQDLKQDNCGLNQARELRFFDADLVYCNKEPQVNLNAAWWIEQSSLDYSELKEKINEYLGGYECGLVKSEEYHKFEHAQDCLDFLVNYPGNSGQIKRWDLLLLQGELTQKQWEFFQKLENDYRSHWAKVDNKVFSSVSRLRDGVNPDGITLAELQCLADSQCAIVEPGGWMKHVAKDLGDLSEKRGRLEVISENLHGFQDALSDQMGYSSNGKGGCLDRSIARLASSLGRLEKVEKHSISWEKVSLDDVWEEVCDLKRDVSVCLDPGVVDRFLSHFISSREGVKNSGHGNGDSSYGRDGACCPSPADSLYSELFTDFSGNPTPQSFYGSPAQFFSADPPVVLSPGSHRLPSFQGGD